MVPIMGRTLEKVVKYLKDKIKKHIREGNYYKCLNRMCSIYVIRKNMTHIEFRTKENIQY